jgi:hypothetical protein
MCDPVGVPRPWLWEGISARGAVVAHVQNTACKRVMSDPVALASFLNRTDRWQCDTCQETWSQRTVFCSCPQQSSRPPLPIQSPAQLAPGTLPPPAPANALPTLERVLCCPAVTMTHIPNPLCSEVAVAWASLAQTVANQNASLDDFTQLMTFPKSILSPLPSREIEAHCQQVLSYATGCAVGQRERRWPSSTMQQARRGQEFNRPGCQHSTRNVCGRLED